MEESTLKWPTDKEREEMEEVCSAALQRNFVKIPQQTDIPSSSCYIATLYSVMTERRSVSLSPF